MNIRNLTAILLSAFICTTITVPAASAKTIVIQQDNNKKQNSKTKTYKSNAQKRHEAYQEELKKRIEWEKKHPMTPEQAQEIIKRLEKIAEKKRAAAGK